MRPLYLIFGEIGAIGSIALSIFLLIQGIGSIVSTLFFVVVPLIIALTLFVTFYRPKSTFIGSVSMIALIIPSITVLPVVYAITQKIVALASPLSAIVALSWFASTLLAVFLLLRRNAHKNIVIHKSFALFTLLTATSMLVTVSNALYPIRIIGFIVSLAFFILSIFDVILLIQVRDTTSLSVLLLLLASLSIILAGCILSAFSIGLFYLPLSTLIAISLILFPRETHATN